MSRVRDLPEIVTLEDNDLLYAVDSSEGPNGGRKITKDNLKQSVALSADEIKTAYESNPDTNAFTDAEQAKLATVEMGAAFQDASEVAYDNSTSGLSATNVQTAIDEATAEAQADFRPAIVSGRILHYSEGTARFDDIFYSLTAGDILLSPSITAGEVYVDLDGIVKQTGSGVNAPPLTIVFAKFSTDLNDIISLTDERVKNTQNLVRGLVADVRDVRAGAAEDAGASGRLSDAMHKHNILTDAASTQTPDQANAEGSSDSLARADHIHNIPAGTPITTHLPSTVNAKGVAANFALSDHTHSFSIALDGDVSTILPNDSAATGATDKFAKASHKHAIATASAVELTDSTNAEGVATSFTRSDHTHAHGNRGGGSLHSAVTTSTNGFMSSTDKSKLDTLVFAFLSYTNSASQSTTQNNTAFTAVTLDTDQSSFTNSLLTKSSATQFRTDFNGYVKISYKLLAQNTSANDVTWRVGILKNGTFINGTENRANGKTNANRFNGAEGTFIVPCTTNDLFTLGFSNAEAATTDTITINAAHHASMSVHAMYRTS